VASTLWLIRFAQLLVERVGTTDLTELRNEELNRLTYRFNWFLVLPDSGHQATTTIDGLVRRESPDVFVVEGDEELTVALNLAVEKVNAEVARRMNPAEHEDLVAWVDRSWRRWQRRDQPRRLAVLVRRLQVTRPRESRERPKRRRVRVRSGSRGDPGPGTGDDGEPSRAVARLEAVDREAA
jgi:hypothetical protein